MTRHAAMPSLPALALALAWALALGCSDERPDCRDRHTCATATGQGGTSAHGGAGGTATRK